MLAAKFTALLIYFLIKKKFFPHIFSVYWKYHYGLYITDTALFTKCQSPQLTTNPWSNFLRQYYQGTFGDFYKKAH